MVTKSAVVGIDIGNLDSIAAYVGKGIVDIVQNEVSQRRTGTAVAFNDEKRLLGDQAQAQIKSNFKNTCRNFRHLLGRGMDAPDVAREKFWSSSELVETGDNGHVGFKVKYCGEEQIYSATQATAMFLTKIREVSETWCDSKVSDVVISVPAYYTDAHRHAVLDAAKIANINVLRLINEHTATALAYGIYRSNEFHEENATTVAFASTGHSQFSLSVVQFIKGKLKVIAEASDRFCGGRDMDEVLIRHFAAEFEKKHGMDPLKNKKSILKLEDAVTKTKKILSSNAEAQIGVECLVEDYDFNSQISRDEFERLCSPLMRRMEAVIEKCMTESGLQIDDIQFIEIVGGASRVPWVQTLLSTKFGKELSKTVNADESVARGAALQAAILSPLYKVRDFSVQDTSAHSISIGWLTTTDADEEEDKDCESAQCDGKQKNAVVFPVGSQFDTLKVLTFHRKRAFDVFASYTNPEQLIDCAHQSSLGMYRIDMPDQSEAKKIKVRAKLTIHGTFEVESAHIVEEEDYEAITYERKELPEEPKDEEMPPANPTEENCAPESENGESEKKSTEEKESEKKPEKKPEKKFETVEVKTMKKRTKKTDVPIISSGVMRLTPEQIKVRREIEIAFQEQTRKIRVREERRNEVESYIYNMRDKINGELASFVKPQDKEVFMTALTAAEEWLYDTYDAETTDFIDKLDELKVHGEPIIYRRNEQQSRAEWVPHIQQTIQNYRTAAQSPSEDYAHIAAEKKEQVVSDCNATEAWLQALLLQQQKLADYDDIVLKSMEIKEKEHALRQAADLIFSEPKPKPAPVPEKPKADTENADVDKPIEPTEMDVDSVN